MIKKIVLFLISFILKIVDLFLDLFIKVECWVSGIVFMILAVCIILAISNQMWLQAGILGGVVITTVAILLLTAEIKLWLVIMA